MSGREIYENFTGGSLAGLTYSADNTSSFAANYSERIDFVQKLLSSMEQAWQGEASGLAARGAGPLMIGHSNASVQADEVATSMRLQADAFNTAKSRVVPIPDMPQQPSGWENFVTLGAAGKRYEQQLTAVQHANDHNVAIMQAYEDASTQNQSRLSEIPDRLKGDYLQFGGDQPPDKPPNGHGPPPLPWRVPPSGGGGRTGGGGGTRTPGSSSGPSGAQWSPQQASQTGNQTAGLTQASVAQPLPHQVPGLDGGWPRPGGQGPSAPGLPLAAGPGPMAGSAGFGSDSGRAAGRGFGPGGSSGGPGGEGGRSGARGGFGPRGGAGFEGSAARGLAGGAGAAGSGGRAGQGGSPQLGGGARGQGDEDFERERPSFLVEPDPDETFGTDEVTAPPVIGG